MDRLTLTQSSLRGTVAGRMINCSIHTVPAGLRLPAGQYVLLPPENNPAYGIIFSIAPAQAPTGGAASALIVKFDSPTVPHKVAAPGVKLDTAVPATTHKVTPPSMKHDAVAAPEAGHKVAPPSIKFDTGSGTAATGPLVLSSRPIAGNSLVVTAGFADLVDAVQRAGGVMLIVA